MKRSALLDLSIEELKSKSLEELRQLAFKYTKIFNQRLYRLEKAGVAPFSSAYNAVKNASNGRARVSVPKDSNTARRTSVRLINHLVDLQEKLRTNKSLSIRETKKIYNQTLREHFGTIESANVSAIGDFWRLFGKMRDLHPRLWYESAVNSEQLVSMAMDYYDRAENPTVEDMYKYITNQLEDIDLQEYQRHNDFIEVMEGPNDIPDELYELWNI